jgi:hypothetical protein
MAARVAISLSCKLLYLSPQSAKLGSYLVIRQFTYSFRQLRCKLASSLLIGHASAFITFITVTYRTSA